MQILRRIHNPALSGADFGSVMLGSTAQWIVTGSEGIEGTPALLKAITL